MRKVQKDEGEGIGMSKTLPCEKWVKDAGTVAQIGSSKDVFHFVNFSERSSETKHILWDSRK